MTRADATGREGEGAVDDRPRREFLTCRLGGETYGVDILRVQEIRGVDGLTRVPRVAPYVRGVFNLRGAIVPIVDPGLMFGFREPLDLQRSSIVVLHADRRLVGLAFSGVSDVVALADDEILPPPDIGQQALAGALSGICVAEGATVLLIDVPRLLEKIREDAASAGGGRPPPARVPETPSAPSVR
jgi:purine-binding chemotaxis protein CheW